MVGQRLDGSELIWMVLRVAAKRDFELACAS
jgi:hypothetical protein